MRRRQALVAGVSTLLAGCVSVSVGRSDAPAVTYYVLQDAGAAAAATAPRAAGALAIQGLTADPLADSTSIAYARRNGERSLYQLAAWSERPSRRLVQLAQQRLEAGGRFASVTQLGQPVQADWLLTLAVEHIYHDVGSTPGRARLAVRAELFDRRERQRVAQRLLVAEPAVAEAAAGDAVAAFAVATAEVLDQLAAWLAASVPARPGR